MKCAESALVVFLYVFDHACFGAKRIQRKFDLRPIALRLAQRMDEGLSMVIEECLSLEKKELRFAEGGVFLFPDPFDHWLLRMNLMQREKVWEKVMLWADDATLLLNHRMSRRSV